MLPRFNFATITFFYVLMTLAAACGVVFGFDGERHNWDGHCSVEDYWTRPSFSVTYYGAQNGVTYDIKNSSGFIIATVSIPSTGGPNGGPTSTLASSDIHAVNTDTYGVTKNHDFTAATAVPRTGGATLSASGGATYTTLNTNGSANCGVTTTMQTRTDSITIGTAPTCEAGAVAVSLAGVGGSVSQYVSKVNLDVLVGSGGSGYLMHFFLGGGTTSQSLSIPSGIASTLDGGPVSAALVGSSYAYSTHDLPGTLTVGVSATTFHCGDTISVVVTATFAPEATPTPASSPTPAPTATAQPSSTPIPGPTAIITPAPYGSPTPASGSTPAPNVSVTSPGGGTAGNVVINNPNDFYGPIKKGLEDAGRGLGAPGDGNGGGGAFGGGNGDHDSGDYDDRGDLDSLHSTLSDGIDAKSSVVSGLSDKINSFKTGALSMQSQTFGSVSSITVPLASIGNAPAIGKISMPSTIDLTPFMGIISTGRLVALWLVRLGFWVATLKLLASQGSTM